MKTIVTAAAVLFAANVSAADIYRDLGAGNSDLSTQRLSAEDFAGVQPSVGDSVERYHGWADGHPDLFKTDPGGTTTSTGRPDIYMGLGASPDLHY
jgi:hypothetical protein